MRRRRRVSSSADSAESKTTPGAGQDSEEPLPPSELDTLLPPAVREAVLKPFTGDFDEMVKRRLVRVGVTYNRTFYFVDRGVQRGIAYEYGQLMEDTINERLKTGNIKVHVIFVPMSRDKLLPALVDGKVDMVAGNLTITPEREKLVDFTDPTRANVSEILVTPPGTPPLASIDDLSGKTVFVRKSSSYYQSLLALNKNLQSAGKEPVVIEAAPENLEDDDLLEMVNAELIPAVIVDDYLAEFWKKVFPGIVLHEQVAVRSGGSLGVAIRKNNPQLKAALNKFMGKNGLGSAFGNTIERRYLVNATYAQQRRLRGRTQEVPGGRPAVPEVQRPVRHGLSVDGRAGLPGVAARPGGQEPGRRHRHHAGDAGHRQGVERRRHQAARTQHPRGRQVHAPGDGHELQRRADG